MLPLLDRPLIASLDRLSQLDLVLVSPELSTEDLSVSLELVRKPSLLALAVLWLLHLLLSRRCCGALLLRRSVGLYVSRHFARDEGAGARLVRVVLRHVGRLAVFSSSCLERLGILR